MPDTDIIHPLLLEVVKCDSLFTVCGCCITFSVTGAGESAPSDTSCYLSDRNIVIQVQMGTDTQLGELVLKHCRNAGNESRTKVDKK